MLLQPLGLPCCESQLSPLYLLHSMLMAQLEELLRVADSLIYPSSVLNWLLISHCRKIHSFWVSQSRKSGEQTASLILTVGAHIHTPDPRVI